MRRGETPARERPLKICWIGGARYTRPLDRTQDGKFRALASLGDLTVIGFSAGWLPARFHQHARFYLLPAPPTPVVRHALMFTAGALLAAWLVLARGARVLVAQSPYEGAAAAWAKGIGRAFGKRVALVMESHGDFERALFLQHALWFPGLYRALMRRAAEYAFRHADALRAISDSGRRQLETWAPGLPIVQFMAWTDLEVFRSAHRGASPSQSQEVVFAGALTPLKGVHVLLEAFSRVRDEYPKAFLSLIGRPENQEYAAQLREACSRLELDGRVTFTGELSQMELAHRLARSRVLVLPSFSEGLGRVIVEAMACGLPAIGSRVGGIPELVEDGVTGWLTPPGDVDALAEALRTAFRCEQLDAMGARARDSAQRAFSTEAYVEGHRQLLEIARGVLEGQG